MELQENPPVLPSTHAMLVTADLVYLLKDPLRHRSHARTTRMALAQ